jgi:hypothetical protein
MGPINYKFPKEVRYQHYDEAQKEIQLGKVSIGNKGLCIMLGNKVGRGFLFVKDAILAKAHPEFYLFTPSKKLKKIMDQDPIASIWWFSDEERIMVLEFCKLMCQDEPETQICTVQSHKRKV